MITFDDMDEYSRWLCEEAQELGKYQFVVAEIKSINKKVCVCATPLAIEPFAEDAANTFIKRWNEAMKNGEADDDAMDEEDDCDFVSMVRDAVLHEFEVYNNMEIVYLLTEY